MLSVSHTQYVYIIGGFGILEVHLLLLLLLLLLNFKGKCTLLVMLQKKEKKRRHCNFTEKDDFRTGANCTGCLPDKSKSLHCYKFTKMTVRLK